MIDELSRSLQALLTLRQTSLDKDLKEFFDRLKKEAPQLASSFARLAEEFSLLSNASITFDRPGEKYEGDPSGTVSLFLFDIRENFELRSNEPIIERANGEATRRRPPRRVACSYLVTAWYSAAEKDRELKEQGLLSQALQVLSRFSTLPNPLLWGSLRDQQPPLPVVTLAADGLKNPAEFWTALGGKLRAAFAVTVTISVPIADPEAPVKLVSEREVRVKIHESD
jgi:Pvc16 N-terminal domain